MLAKLASSTNSLVVAAPREMTPATDAAADNGSLIVWQEKRGFLPLVPGIRGFVPACPDGAALICKMLSCHFE
jgi:hypothetical protein